MSSKRESPPPPRDRTSTETPRIDMTQLPAQELVNRIRSLQARVDELSSQNELLRERKTRTRVLGHAAQLQTTFDAIRDGICLLDWKGRILRCNRAFQEFLGKGEQEILGHFYTEVMRVIPSFVETLPIGHAWQMRTRVGIDLAIGDRWYAVTVDPLLDEKGESGGAVCVIREITARKTSEQEVRESERRLRLATAQVPAILWTTDTQLRFTSSNGAGLAALGLAPNQVVGMDLFEYFKTEDREHSAIAAHRRALSGESITYDQEWGGRLFHSHVEPLRNQEGTITGTIGIAQDITDRVQAERALSDMERELHAVVGQVPAILWTTDGELRITLSVGAGLAAMGLKPGERVGMTIPDAVGSHDPEFLPNAMHLRALSGESVTYEMEFGGRSWTTHIDPLKDARGRISGVIGVTLDITEKKRAEEALEEAEARFRKVYEGAPIGISLVSPERRFVMANPTYCRMLGYTEEELREKTFVDVTHPEDLTASIDLEKRGRAVEAPATLEKRYRRKGGETIWVRVTVRAIYDSRGELLCWLCMAEDITDRKALELQLRQSQKMEAVGRIAGAVAHDFNNLVAAIRGYVDLMGKGREGDEALQGDVEAVRGVLTRAAEMTRQLLTLGSRAQSKMVTVDLAAVVTNLAEMLQRLVGERVRVSHASEADLRGVKADPRQVEQVLMNLALNARDAMPEGGELSIETRNADFTTESAARRVGGQAGRYVLLSVRDTGVGMDAGVQARLFEPYFTTKGGGTGLGLSTVYGAVRQSGGHIAVESAPGKGTTFRIWLPAVPR